MAIALNKITKFLFFLLLNSLVFYSIQSLTSPRNPDSLVLGLTLASTASFPTGPKASTTSRKIVSMDVSGTKKPLMEVRDGYLISLNIGTPPQVIQVRMDTGSDLTWVPCGNPSFDCMECDDYRNNKLITASFSPSYSSSSYRDSCASPFCIDIHSSDNPVDPCTVSGCSLSNEMYQPRNCRATKSATNLSTSTASSCTSVASSCIFCILQFVTIVS